MMSALKKTMTILPIGSKTEPTVDLLEDEESRNQSPSGGQERTVSIQELSDTIRVPNLSVAAFCKEYALSDAILRRIEKAGFETAGALLETSDSDLKAADFKPGQIAELKRALKDFLFKNRILMAPS
ncbi:hypothetical protein B0H19DRAFT_1155495 [Mycena capillaripes]|nr:hypothetical protein B0H19DRAFT_1155495 [Mycena capillaripes]